MQILQLNFDIENIGLILSQDCNEFETERDRSLLQVSYRQIGLIKLIKVGENISLLKPFPKAKAIKIIEMVLKIDPIL